MNMDCNSDTKSQPRRPIYADLTPDEQARFEAFLEVRGAKKGPFTRQLILREMAAADHSGMAEDLPATLGDLRGCGGSAREGK